MPLCAGNFELNCISHPSLIKWSSWWSCTLQFASSTYFNTFCNLHRERSNALFSSNFPECNPYMFGDMLGNVDPLYSHTMIRCDLSFVSWKLSNGNFLIHKLGNGEMTALRSFCIPLRLRIRLRGS